MTKMKCVIRDNLDKMKVSVCGLAEQAKSTPGAPSYSTIDNFIRNGTGNLETAWAITKLMGLTLNDNFIDDDKETDESSTADTNVEATIQAIIADIRRIGKIEKPVDVATILYAIGTAISTLGYDEEAGSIINMSADYIKMMNAQGGNGDV